jgi:zinc protease
MLLGALLSATPALATAQLPSAEQIFDRYATAIGGRDAWRPVTGRSERGTIEITFADLTGSYERHQMLPNKLRLLIDVGVLQIDNGFDGEKGWESQGGTLTRMTPEEERDLALPQADGAAFLDVSRYASVTVAGVERFADTEAYKVLLTSRSGQQTAEFFAVEGGLRLGSISADGPAQRVVSFGNYMTFEGKKVPTRIVQNNGQGEIIITIESVTFGSPSADLFRAPSGLR